MRTSKVIQEEIKVRSLVILATVAFGMVTIVGLTLPILGVVNAKLAALGSQLAVAAK